MPLIATAHTHTREARLSSANTSTPPKGGAAAAPAAPPAPAVTTGNQGPQGSHGQARESDHPHRERLQRQDGVRYVHGHHGARGSGGKPPAPAQAVEPPAAARQRQQVQRARSRSLSSLELESQSSLKLKSVEAEAAAAQRRQTRARAKRLASKSQNQWGALSVARTTRGASRRKSAYAADSASDDNEGDVVDGETAFWDLIESSQITRDGVVNKPRKKPAASMTHPSTCGKDSLSRHSQDSRQSGKKVSPSSDSSKKKSRVELEQEWRKQRKQSSRSVSPPSKSSNSRSLEDPAAGSVPDTSSSPRSRFFSRRKRSQSPGGTVKKYGTMREKGGGFLRSRSRSRHKKTSSLEGEVDGIDLAEPKNTGKPSPRSHSAAPRRSPFSAQRKSPLASGAGAGDANKLSPQESEAATTRGTSPRNRPGGGGVRGLLRRLSRDSQYNDDLKPEDPTTDDVGAGGATSSSGQSQTPPQKPLPSMPAGGAKGGAQDKFSLRVHAGGDPSNEPSRSSSAAARHLAPTGSGHTRTLSIAAHEPNEHSPVLGTKSAPSSSSGAAARLIPDPSLRAKRAKVVHVPPVASMDSMGADPARPQLHTHHSSGLSALNTPPSDLSRPSSRKGSTSSSRGVTLVKSRRASRDPGGAVLLPTSAPVLQASASAPPVSGGGSLAASSGVPDAPPSPAPSSSASSTGSKSRSLRRPIVTV